MSSTHRLPLPSHHLPATVLTFLGRSRSETGNDDALRRDVPPSSVARAHPYRRLPERSAPLVSIINGVKVIRPLPIRVKGRGAVRAPMDAGNGDGIVGCRSRDQRLENQAHPHQASTKLEVKEVGGGQGESDRKLINVASDSDKIHNPIPSHTYNSNNKNKNNQKNENNQKNQKNGSRKRSREFKGFYGDVKMRDGAAEEEARKAKKRRSNANHRRNKKERKMEECRVKEQEQEMGLKTPITSDEDVKVDGQSEKKEEEDEEMNELTERFRRSCSIE